MRLIQKIISVGKPSSKNILVENFVVEKFVFLRKKMVLKNSLVLQIFGPKNFSVFWGIEDRINPMECEGK